MRGPVSVLFKIGKILIAWGFKNVRVDEEAVSISTGGQPVAKTRTIDGKVQCEWHGAWASRKECYEHHEITNAISEGTAILTRAAASSGKGKGKLGPISVQDPWAGKAGNAGKGSK